MIETTRLIYPNRLRAIRQSKFDLSLNVGTAIRPPKGPGGNRLRKMPIGFVLFLVFVGVPMAEIAAFILIGEQIGLVWTLTMVVVTALIGSMLLRIQGLAVLNAIRSEMDQGRVPGAAIGHGAMIAVAGLLLLTPGFVTDSVGFLLFVPGVRETIWRTVRNRIRVTVMEHGRSRPVDDRTVDLDPDDYTDGPDASSPWRNK